MKIVGIVSQWASWLIAFLLGAASSGLVWDEMSHQLVERGWTQKLCHSFIKVGARAVPCGARDEYVRQSLGEIEEKLAGRRHLAAVIASLSCAVTLEARVWVLTYTLVSLSTFHSIYFAADLWVINFGKLSPDDPLYEILNCNVLATLVFGTGLLAEMRSAGGLNNLLEVYQHSKWLRLASLSAYVIWLISCIVSIPVLYDSGYTVGGVLLSTTSVITALSIVTMVQLQSESKTV